MRFAITTLGCKVNQYDGAAVAAALRRLGLRRADDGPPDLLVINTCCVTAAAMRKSRQALRRAVRNTPEAAVLVIGCYCDYDARTVADLLADLGVPADRTFLAGHHEDLNERIKQVAATLAGGVRPVGSHRPGPSALRRHGRYLGGNDVYTNACYQADTVNTSDPTSIKTRRLAAVKRNVAGTSRLGPIDRFDAHQRAFVKVQDGCDAFCAYCIVPFTRPVVRSRSIHQIEQECRTLVAAGHRELVLSGVFLGAFGRQTAQRRRWRGRSPLPDLIRRVAGIEGLWRVRLSSLEAGDLTDELIETCRGLDNFAPHLHLPLQSGSPRILRRMNRQYTVEQFRAAVDRARAAFDRPALTTDVLVGFPGESDEDFAATLDLARYAGFAKIHAFPFSPVHPTAAWVHRRDAPPAAVVKRRMAELAELEHELASAYRRQFVGEAVEALVHRPRRAAGCLEALTDRYLTVRFERPDGRRDELTGTVVRLRVDEVTADGADGTLLGPAVPPAAARPC